MVNFLLLHSQHDNNHKWSLVSPYILQELFLYSQGDSKGFCILMTEFGGKNPKTPQNKQGKIEIIFLMFLHVLLFL